MTHGKNRSKFRKIRIATCIIIIIIVLFIVCLKTILKKDIDYIVSTRYKIFELYPYMPFDDFQSAWKNVPGWKTLEFAQEHVTEGGPEWISVFEKELPLYVTNTQDTELFKNASSFLYYSIDAENDLIDMESELLNEVTTF